MGRAITQDSVVKRDEESGLRCRRPKCSKLCVHLRSADISPRTNNPYFSKHGETNNATSQTVAPEPVSSHEVISPEPPSDEDSFLTPVLSSASTYATPCGKNYSFVLAGILDPDVYKLCAQMYRKFLLDWVDGKLEIFPEPFPPKMESLLDLSFPDVDIPEGFYWDEPLKVPARKGKRMPFAILVAFILGLFLKKVTQRWLRKP